MRPKMTRRELAAVAMALSGAARPVLAVPEGQQSPEKLLAREQADVRRDATELEKFRVPMETEPAFVFKP